MNPRVAYIDHDSYVRELVANELLKRGMTVAYESNIRGFILRHGDLGLFPVLLYHPGIHQQKLIRKVFERYPNTTVALVTYAPTDYDQDIPVLNCWNYDEIAKFVREHQ